MSQTYFEPDVYDPGAEATSFDLVENVIASVPEIEAIHRQAANEGWFETATGRARYKRAIQQSQWYQENNKYARAASIAFEAAQKGQGADWQALLQNARLAIEQRAMELGVALTEEQKKALESQYVYQGWGQDGRDRLLDQALAQNLAPQAGATGVMGFRGNAGQVVENLRRTALENGLTYDDGYYQSAARSVVGGLTSEEDQIRDIQEQAASLWPVFSDKIRAGFSARQLASPYIQMMAQEFEINPNDINLSDPYIRSALGGFGADGSPQAMNMWDFQKKLRQDPRWMNTLKAQNEVTSVTGRVMQMFGLLGG